MGVYHLFVKAFAIAGCAVIVSCGQAPETSDQSVADLAVTARGLDQGLTDAPICGEPDAGPCEQTCGTIPCCTEGEVYCQLTIACQFGPPFTVSNVCMHSSSGELKVCTEFYECPMPDLAHPVDFSPEPQDLTLADSAVDGG
jgi:hypothetical protein